MAGNNFRIPQWTPELVNWSNAVHARNDANAKARQDQWNKIYDMVAAYGERRRAEDEAEKARQEQFEQAGIERQFRAQEAEKQRAFQAAENAANRQAQNAQNAALQNQARQQNLGKINAEVAELNAQRDLELGKYTNPADKALVNNLYNTKIDNVYAKFGMERPQLQEVLSLPTPVANENPVATPAEVPAPLTDAQIKKNTEDLAKSMKNDRQTISTMPNGPKKAKLMEEYNEQNKENFGITGVNAYTAEEIKKAGIAPKTYLKEGTIVDDSQYDELSKIYRMQYLPTTGQWKITGRK
jgi:hypothetical protein